MPLSYRRARGRFFNLATLIREGHVKNFKIGPAGANIDPASIEHITLDKVVVYGLAEEPKPNGLPQEKHVITLIMKPRKFAEGVMPPWENEIHIYAPHGRGGPVITYVPTRREEREQYEKEKRAYRRLRDQNRR